MPSGRYFAGALIVFGNVVMEDHWIAVFLPSSIGLDFRYDRLTLAHVEMQTAHYIHIYDIETEIKIRSAFSSINSLWLFECMQRTFGIVPESILGKVIHFRVSWFLENVLNADFIERKIAPCRRILWMVRQTVFLRREHHCYGIQQNKSKFFLTFKTVALYDGSRQKVRAGYARLEFNSNRECVVIGGNRSLAKHSVSYKSQRKSLFYFGNAFVSKNWWPLTWKTTTTVQIMSTNNLISFFGLVTMFRRKSRHRLLLDSGFSSSIFAAIASANSEW